MLPGLNRDRISLADVLPSCLASLSAEENPLGLGVAKRIVIVLVDGLGASALAARNGHARVLAAADGDTIESVFPTTTAAALGSLATGMLPGEHGLVGYSVLDSANDRLVNQLSGWDDQLDPATWQRKQTVFERSRDAGFGAVVVGPARYADSGFTAAVLRGADYRSAASIADRFAVAARWLREPGAPGLLYLYVPELDSVAHKSGWESAEWTRRLEELDSNLGQLAAALLPQQVVLVTADHGVVDVPATSHVLIDSAPELVTGVRFVGGEPRCLQLYLEPDLSEASRDTLVKRWHDSEDGRSWVVTRQEAVDAGWFGQVAPEVASRIGDLLVAARKNIAYYDTRTSSPSSQAMIGQHGSWSPAELQIPLKKFGV